ncbi:hypothetical protein AZ002_003584 [Citrobacter freundii]|nr:hypothetical protein AZ003_000895 [Citrobacter freundii]OUE61372.1 hypothetical protein AZ002_003584 [Citrobacter freundii]CAE7295937.1 hypothetical protein AI2609V1_2742 [Citrobacter freundii]CAH3653924.1 hypothetical protein AI2609V1_2742 [Citrobacter freundii]
MHKVQYRLSRRRKPTRQVLLLNLKKLGKVGAGVPFMTFTSAVHEKNPQKFVLGSYVLLPSN